MADGEATGDGGVRFRATLEQAKGKKATGIVVPPAVMAALDHGKKPPVRVVLNGHEYRSTVGTMGGQSMVGVSAAIRDATGLAAGDPVEVELTVDTTPRTVDVPDDLAAAFAANPGAGTFFSTLSNSNQRYHVDNITGAKSPETRRRRIDKAVSLFLEGRAR